MARIVVSQNERILLHLSDLDKFRDDPDVPMGASQEGIAQKLDTQIFNASRSLSSLESDGLVFDRLAHVRGAPKRRRAYFLTEKGKAAAHAIRTDIGKRAIVIEHSGKTQELTVDDAARKLTSLIGRTVSLSEVAEKAREFEVVLSSSLAGPGEETPAFSKECVLRSHGRPKVEVFFGRDQELKALLEAMHGSSTPAILIWGMPGIGKSTLASKLFDELVGKHSLFWYSFHEWETEASFLNVLTEFLIASGRTSASNSLRHGHSSSDMFLPLLNDLSGCDAVLFLDDIQKPTRDLSSLLSVIVEAVKSSSTSKVVLISRSVPTFFSKTETGHMSLELAGIDRDSAWKFAQSLNAKDSIRLVDESHGHPLLLTLMARGGISAAKGDVISFIEREVYSSLSEKERHVLELLSIFRHPVPIDALGDGEYKTISSLRKRALVVEQEDGVWTHDLLRDFFVSRLGVEAKESLHRNAASYCMAKEGIEWSLEALYHSVEGRDWAGAAKISISHAVDLAKEFPQETLTLLFRMDIEALTGKDRTELLFVRGQLNEAVGGLEVALADFEASLKLLGSEPDAPRRAIVLETVAKLQSQVQRWTESVATHEKALRIYEKANDKEGQSREWANIGSVLRKKGDIEKAREAYNKALSLSTMDEDRPSQAASLNNLGLLDWDEGRFRDAETHMTESVKLAHAVKDHAGEARGLENLGNLFRAEGKLSDAAKILLESSEAYKRAGEVMDFKRLQASSAEVMGALGRHREGIDICESALSKPELRRRRGLFQRSSRYDAGDLLLSSTLVDLLRSSGEHKKAMNELTRYMMMSESVPDQTAVARGKLMTAMVQEDVGDLDSAKKSLAEAEAILASEGNSDGLVAVHIRTGTIDEKLGDYASAAGHYAEAVRHAERSGNQVGLAIARENLESVTKSNP